MFTLERFCKNNSRRGQEGQISVGNLNKTKNVIYLLIDRGMYSSGKIAFLIVRSGHYFPRIEIQRLLGVAYKHL